MRSSRRQGSCTSRVWRLTPHFWQYLSQSEPVRRCNSWKMGSPALTPLDSWSWQMPMMRATSRFSARRSILRRLVAIQPSLRGSRVITSADWRVGSRTGTAADAEDPSHVALQRAAVHIAPLGGDPAKLARIEGDYLGGLESGLAHWHSRRCRGSEPRRASARGGPYCAAWWRSSQACEDRG